MILKRWRLMPCMALMLLLLIARHSYADEKIILMVSSIEKQIYLPAKLAEQLAYLKETGLDIELKSAPTGADAEKEMLSGAAHGVIGFYDHTISLQARGKLVQSVIQFSQAPGEVVLVAKDYAGRIRAPSDFKDKTIGVTALGSSTHVLGRFLAYRAGLKAKDLSFVPVGAGEKLISAMAQGRIHVVITTEPTVSRLLDSGSAAILFDLRTVSGTEHVLGGLYPGACLYMPKAWIERNRDSVQKIVTAFVKTLRYIDTHSAAEIADKMPSDYYTANKARYVSALESGKSMFTPHGNMPKGAPETVLRVLKESDRALQTKPINLNNTYSEDYVEEAKRVLGGL